MRDVGRGTMSNKTRGMSGWPGLPDGYGDDVETRRNRLTKHTLYSPLTCIPFTSALGSFEVYRLS